MVDVAAVGCFASLAEATRYRPRAFLRRGFCRVDDALRLVGLVLVLVVAFTVLGVDPYLGVGSISDSLSLLMIITRDEKRELLRTRDRVAAEVFEVLHLVLREVPALVSYRREILVDGSRGFLLFVEAANIYIIFPI